MCVDAKSLTTGLIKEAPSKPRLGRPLKPLLPLLEQVVCFVPGALSVCSSVTCQGVVYLFLVCLPELKDRVVLSPFLASPKHSGRQGHV